MAENITNGIDDENIEVTETEAAEAVQAEPEEPKRPVSSNVKQNGDNEPHCTLFIPIRDMRIR